MKRILHLALIIIAADYLFYQCANPQTPTGGPKDTIPPELIHSNPISGSTNFNENTLTLEFSEYVNADKLNQNLIITPQIDLRYKHLIKRNVLSIKFDEPFEDSTTYSFNFFDGVTDITEKSPAINLVIAFSTGDFIDSMRVSGKVTDLLSQTPSGKFTVGLYHISDSLNLLSDTPMYFTTTDDSGSYNISYVKTGRYRLISFNDDNRNLILDSETEAHGFIHDTLELFNPQENMDMPTVLQDVSPLRLINNRSIGPYHEIKFSKHLIDYEILPDSLFHNIVGNNNDIIRIYNPAQFNYEDSITINIEARDSLQNEVVDTLKILFIESNRKPAEFTSSIIYKEEDLTNDPVYHFNFNKPISTVDESKILFTGDTLFASNPDSLQLNWNINRTQLELKAFVNKDSILKQLADIIPFDTIQTDSVQVDSLITEENLRKNIPPLSLTTEAATFISIEEDSSSVMRIIHKPPPPKAEGVLMFNVNTSAESFFIQLLSSGKVAYELYNERTPSFNVKPGNYAIRILIDTNGDGKWSHGNLLANEPPEEVYLFPESISVRENWIVGEDIIVSF